MHLGTFAPYFILYPVIAESSGVYLENFLNGKYSDKSLNYHL